MTLVASVYYHFGFNRTLDPVNNDNFSLRVNTDQDHNGLTIGKLTYTDSGELLLTCNVSHYYKSPFCEVSFDYTPKPGMSPYLDLSKYDEVAFDVVYSGVSQPKSLFIIRNHNEQYSAEDDLLSDKFNIFEFNTDQHNSESPLSLNYLYVPKWWFDYYHHPVTVTAMDISQSVSIEIGTAAFVAEGISVFKIRSIEFKGKWLPIAVYQRIIIAVWIVTLFAYLIWYVIKILKTLRAEKETIVHLQSHLSMLQKEVSIDPLTRLRNRRGLESLFQTVEQLAQHKHNVSVGVMDIDHFKKINDTHGHAIGDDVLRQFSQNLIDTARNEDILIRWGGEEFVMIKVGCSLAQAELFFNQLRASMKAQIWPQGLDVTFSTGVVEISNEFVESAIERADALLYQAKLAGRDRVITQ